MTVAELVPLSRVATHDVECLLDAAFGIDRHGRTAYLLRAAMPVIDRLAFGITENTHLIASIQCWPVIAANAPLILVGPVAVSPARQSQGLGTRLMTAMIGAITQNDPPLVMIGDPEYYKRFGFSAARTSGWILPGPWEPHRLLLRDAGSRTLPATAMLGPRTSL